MFSISGWLNLKYLILADAVPLPSYTTTCQFSGECPEKTDLSASLQTAVTNLLDYFINDPDKLAHAILEPCKVIAGVGALYMLTPIMLDLSKFDRGVNYSKVVLLFMLMIMFTNDGYYGRQLALGNYAFITGIQNAIVKQIGNPGAVTTMKTTNYMKDTAEVLAINKQLSICLGYANIKTLNENSQIATNPSFEACEAKLRNLINTSKFDNSTSGSVFKDAVAEPDFVSMAIKIVKFSVGFPIDVTQLVDVDNGYYRKISGTSDLLRSWYAALALMPDVAFMAALLYFPIPLAFSFLSTSYLQAWFTGFWSVGFFKFAMTIFTLTFRWLQYEIGGGMPDQTVNLALGIALPTMAIALATGSGLGLSGLISQGASSLSSGFPGVSPTNKVPETSGASQSKKG
jgi:uncharacterized membrane protein